eukprot:CAMPEP_0196658738 /NCGR_PEP_ID=MMETSP1086-20130531/31221_1 /TAXON_ID=77921 /ORGANISM="Cyanoptyche  gloeocystis , Strain SAG4.97" /LENGTH=91 /DNA_ID=CAMNT_0041992437 /DNA_START=313 /DNA_END=585 /DNA_ORIENTATION=-
MYSTGWPRGPPPPSHATTRLSDSMGGTSAISSIGVFSLTGFEDPAAAVEPHRWEVRDALSVTDCSACRDLDNSENICGGISPQLFWARRSF